MFELMPERSRKPQFSVSNAAEIEWSLKPNRDSMPASTPIWLVLMEASTLNDG
ncbi:hypothetical protein OAS67_09195 [Alphaproteobacteria bacterium]|nr:hypothetical protein [Alphaproteobacteria bacterium]